MSLQQASVESTNFASPNRDITTSSLAVAAEVLQERHSWEDTPASGSTQDVDDRASRRRTWNEFEDYHAGTSTGTEMSQEDRSYDSENLGLYCKVKKRILNVMPESVPARLPKDTDRKAWKKLERENTLRSRNKKLISENRFNTWKSRAVNFALPSLPATPRRSSLADPVQARPFRRTATKHIVILSPTSQTIKTPYPTPSPEDDTVSGTSIFTREYLFSRFTPSGDKDKPLESKKQGSVVRLKKKLGALRERWTGRMGTREERLKETVTFQSQEASETPLRLSLSSAFTTSNLDISFEPTRSVSPSIDRNDAPRQISGSTIKRVGFRFTVPPFSQVLALASKDKN